MHVHIVFPCYERPEVATMVALIRETHDLSANQIGWTLTPEYGIYPTALACNHGVAIALADEKMTHVLIWGADNYPIENGAIRKLLDTKFDVVGSVIACKNEPIRFGFQPLDNDVKGETASMVRVNDCVEVKRVGSGFMLISRAALEAVSKSAPAFKSNYPGDARPLLQIFRDEIHPATGEWTPEDYYFCDRARTAGFKIWMNVTTGHGHIGKKDYRGRIA